MQTQADTIQHIRATLKTDQPCLYLKTVGKIKVHLLRDYANSLDFKALSKGLARHDCQPSCALLKGESQDGSEDESPGELVTILGACTSTRDHCSRAHRARCQHRPVEQRPHLRDDLVVKHGVVCGGGDKPPSSAGALTKLSSSSE